MTPGEASKKGKTLIIDHPIGGRMIAAHVFDLADGGIVFLDSGWTEPLVSSHVVHAIEGSTSEADYFREQRWQVDMGREGDAFIYVLQENVEPEGSRESAAAAIKKSISYLIFIE